MPQKHYVKNMAKILLARHKINKLLMKLLTTCSFNGRNLYKFVTTIIIIVGASMVNLTTLDLA